VKARFFDGDVSSQAYVASDNVSKAANNLGVIDGRAAFTDYVGRFDERDLFRFSLEDDAEVDISLDRGGSDAEIFLLDKNRFLFTVGDVSDKGIPAALFMSMTKSLIRLAAEGNLKPEQILHKVNNELARENEQSMFVTVFVAILNIETGRLVYANAGHSMRQHVVLRKVTFQ